MNPYEQTVSKRQTYYAPYQTQDSQHIQEQLGNIPKKTPELDLVVNFLFENIKRQEEAIQNLVQKLHPITDAREPEGKGEERVRVERITPLGKKLDTAAEQIERLTHILTELTRRVEL